MTAYSLNYILTINAGDDDDDDLREQKRCRIGRTKYIISDNEGIADRKKQIPYSENLWEIFKIRKVFLGLWSFVTLHY